MRDSPRRSPGAMRCIFRTTARIALDRPTMATRWETADSVWLEKAGGAPFELVASAGMARVDWAAQAPGRMPDVARLLGASLPAACTHAPIYPQGFVYCPECGKPLTSYAGRIARLPAWWGASSAALPVDHYPLPRHVPHGLPVTALPLAASLETRVPEPAIRAAERAVRLRRRRFRLRRAAFAGAGLHPQRAAILGPGGRRVASDGRRRCRGRSQFQRLRLCVAARRRRCAAWRSGLAAVGARTAALDHQSDQPEFPHARRVRRAAGQRARRGRPPHRLPVRVRRRRAAVDRAGRRRRCGSAALRRRGDSVQRLVASLQLRRSFDLAAPAGPFAVASRCRAAMAAVAGRLDAAPAIRRPGEKPSRPAVADRPRRAGLFLPGAGPRRRPAGTHRRRAARLRHAAVPARPPGQERTLGQRGCRGPDQGRCAGAAAAGKRQQHAQPAHRPGAAFRPLHRQGRSGAGRRHFAAYLHRMDRPAQRDTRRSGAADESGRLPALRLRQLPVAAPSEVERDTRLAFESADVTRVVASAAGLTGLACALACAAGAQAAPLPHAVSHVFLVQNSGWMEPFYTDPSSQYKPLISAVVAAATQPGDALVLASFNQSLPNAPSPKALLATKVDASSSKQVAAALAPLAVAHKPGSAVLADTDLGEAVGAAIDTALDHHAGLVWLFTNNKNSPNNDQATAQRNREFYQLIHNGADIS